MDVFIVVVIGVLLSFCGISYKIGQKGSVYPIELATVLAIFGMGFFGLAGADEWGILDWRIVIFGMVMGLTQYAGIRLMRTALKIGPFSPAWCAASLAFVPSVIYSTFYGESLSGLQVFSLLATGAAIVCASLGKSSGGRIARFAYTALYGLLLILLLVFSGVIYIALKFAAVYTAPGAAAPLAVVGGKLLMFFTYLFIGIGGAVDLTLSHSWRLNRYTVQGGLLLSFSAVGAFALTIHFIELPAVLLFALSSTVSILMAAIMSSLFFGERRSVYWYLTLAFSVAAIVLNR